MKEQERDAGVLLLLERLEILPRVEVAIDGLTPPDLSKPIISLRGRAYRTHVSCVSHSSFGARSRMCLARGCVPRMDRGATQRSESDSRRQVLRISM